MSLEGRGLLKEDKDLNLVLQDEWVRLVRGQENIPSGREDKSKGGEGGMAMDCSQELRRRSSHVCMEGRGQEGARWRTGKVSGQGVEEWPGQSLALGRKCLQPEDSRLEAEEHRGCGSEGQRRKGRHKAAKRESLGVDALSVSDLEGSGDRDKAGRGKEEQTLEMRWRAPF